MKCYNHPQIDAVGTCSQCGKGGCRDCIEDVGGAMLCENCFNLHKGAQEAEENAVVASQMSVVNRSKKIVRVSLILGVVGAVAGFVGSFFNPNQGGQAIANGIAGAYFLPCLYLGIPRIWGWWRSLWQKIGCFLWATPFGWILLFLLFFYIPFGVGFLYGIFGGGIVEFFRHLRISKRKV